LGFEQARKGFYKCPAGARGFTSGIGGGHAAARRIVKAQMRSLAGPAGKIGQIACRQAEDLRRT
jgi:hypothetical protein